MILRRNQQRTAFVLSGGGNLGALQVGMLTALAEHDIVPDVVLGCSVGALNGAAYSRAPTRAGVQRLADRWRDIESPTLMPSSLVPNALQLLRKGASLHDNQGLRETVEAMLGDQLTFESLAVEFQCVATNVDTAMAEWFTEGQVVPAVLASAALPAVYPPVELDGVRYLAIREGDREAPRGALVAAFGRPPDGFADGCTSLHEERWYRVWRCPAEPVDAAPDASRAP